MDLFVFALLPFALFSLVRRQPSSTAGFLQFLAPIVASGVTSLIKHKQQKSAEKKAAAYEKQQADAAAAAERASFEAQQNSPSALAQRQKFTLQLGKLLGKAGGKDKIPPSIYNYLQSQRQAQQYVGGPAYTPKPSSGAGLWDFLGGAAEALSYADTSKLKGKPRPTGPTGLEGATFQTGQLNKVIPKAGLAVQTTTRQPWENVLSPGQPVRRG